MALPLFAASMCIARLAEAHAAGEARFASPIPGWVVLAAAAAALLLSFLLLNWSTPGGARTIAYPSRPVERVPLLRWLVEGRLLRTLACWVSVGLLLLILVAGFFGHPSSDYNAAPHLIWTLFWFGLSLFSFLVGNPWDIVNPWRTIYDWACRITRRNLTFGLRYPDRLGLWPAFLLYIGWIWFEMTWFQSDEPGSLGVITLLFSAYLWLGMVCFGRTWLDRADPFTRYFRVLGAFAPIGQGRNGMEIRSYAVAIPARTIGSRLEVSFIIAIMYSVTYDGFMATQEWVALIGNLMRPAMRMFPDVPVMEEVQLLMLVGGLIVFVAAYWGACAGMASLADGPSTADLARAFGYTLLPIAFGYYVSHFFMVIGPRFAAMGRILPDPLGWSAAARASPAAPPSHGIPLVLTTEVVWACQMILIVLGHVFSVITAHRVAQSALSGSRRFVASQIPLLALMILYTWISLWITSRPLLLKPLVPVMEDLLKGAVH